jgi:hypothetical protein
MPFPLVALSKAWVCDRLLAVIVGLSLLSVVCFEAEVPDNPYGGLLPSVACLSVTVKPR